MTCHDVRESFSALVDDALTPAERAALDAHIQGCAECRRELDRFRGTVALLRAIEPARAPVGFVDDVLAATRPDPWPRRLIRRLFVPLPVKLPIEAALVALVAVTAVYVFQRTPEVQQAARPDAPSHAAPSPAEPPARPTPSPSEPPTQADRERPRDLRPAPPRVSEVPRRESPIPPPLPLGSAPSSETEGGASRAATPGPRAPGAGGAIAPGATEPREGASAEAPKSPPQPSVHRFSTRALISVDVSGRLLVKRREAAASALTELIARVGGTELGRRPDPASAAGQLLELLIPRGTYAEFVQGLGRLGDWRVEAELAELPDPIRLVVRMTD